MRAYASKLIDTAANGKNSSGPRGTPRKSRISSAAWSSQPPPGLRELDSSSSRTWLDQPDLLLLHERHEAPAEHLQAIGHDGEERLAEARAAGLGEVVDVLDAQRQHPADL